MTEKEFLEQSWNGAQSYSAVGYRALDLAKQCGATFDSEPIDLPPLQVSGMSPLNTGFCQSVCTAPLPGYPYGRALTGSEANEVIRRCKLIPLFREYISTSFVAPEFVQILLDKIDGKIK